MRVSFLAMCRRSCEEAVVAKQLRCQDVSTGAMLCVKLSICHIL